MQPPNSMQCPLCGRTLNNPGDFDPKLGRFHCPACYDTSREAQKGWLPPAERPMVPSADAPSGPTRLSVDKWFALSADGKPVARERTCECGRRFSQRLLSSHFLEIAEKARAIELVTKQIPGYFVPVHCPACERRDIGMQARKDEYKHQPQHAQPFGEAAD